MKIKAPLYVILGQNGKIGKQLKHLIIKDKDKDVLGLSWHSPASDNLRLKGLHVKSIKKAVNEGRRLIIVDCLMGNTDIQTESLTHLSLLRQFRLLGGNNYFIYLSTFECKQIHNTNYRKMKSILEPLMISKGAFVIRFGWVPKSKLEDKKITKKKFLLLLTDEYFNPLILPITYLKDLINKISQVQSEVGNNIIRCYSEEAHLAVSIPGLKLNIIHKNSALKFIKVPIPLNIINWFLQPLIKLIKMKFKNHKVIDFLEKSQSFLDHQKILNTNNQFFES